MRGLLSFILTGACASFLTSSVHAASTSIPGGAMAARFVFKNTYPDGSFEPYSGSGTIPSPGKGHPAKRVFNADGSLLASSTTDSTWPGWIKGLEIGISGANNSNATNASCARFASGESTTKCCFKSSNAGAACTNLGTEEYTCGVPNGLFRVSEVDCMNNTPAVGTGGPNDGVYVRITLNRDTTYLGADENLMAVVEYAGSSLRAGAQDPAKCFVNGKFTPTNSECSDFSWQLFLKHYASETVLPFMNFIPPSPFALRTAATNATNANTSVNAGGVNTRQFILPISRDKDLSVLQLSRITAISKDLVVDSDSHEFEHYCKNSNSPLCMGLVIYAITLYRM